PIARRDVEIHAAEQHPRAEAARHAVEPEQHGEDGSAGPKSRALFARQGAREANAAQQRTKTRRSRDEALHPRNDRCMLGETRLLIEAVLRRQGKLRYVPVDISQSMLDESAQALLADYRGLEITAIASEYRSGLRHLGKDTHLPKLIAWLGSNIGNFTRAEARHFLGGIRDAMSPEDRLLLGVDLRKDAHVLWRAYDDAQGVTARFNKNLLARINRE